MRSSAVSSVKVRQVGRATRVAHGRPNKRFFCSSGILSRSAQELGPVQVDGACPRKGTLGGPSVVRLRAAFFTRVGHSVFFDFSVAQSSSFSPSHFFSFSPFPSSLSSSLCSSSLLFLFFFSLSLLLLPSSAFLSLSAPPSPPPPVFSAHPYLPLPPFLFPFLSRLFFFPHVFLGLSFLLSPCSLLTLTVSHSLSCDNNGSAQHEHVSRVT